MSAWLILWYRKQYQHIYIPGNVIFASDLCCKRRFPSELNRNTLNALCSIPIEEQCTMRCIPWHDKMCGSQKWNWEV
jgi:hypothetical protein